VWLGVAQGAGRIFRIPLRRYPRRDLRLAAEAEPPLDPPDTEVDVSSGEAESCRDGTVIEPIRDEECDVALAWSQAPSPSARRKWQPRRGINRVHARLERRRPAKSDADRVNLPELCYGGVHRGAAP